MTFLFHAAQIPHKLPLLAGTLKGGSSLVGAGATQWEPSLALLSTGPSYKVSPWVSSCKESFVS